MKSINDIDVTKLLFAQLMETPMKYIVPSYQRAYMWSKKESVTLFNDLILRFRSGELSYLNGITLSAPTLDSTATERKIVDGQQRLLTLSIYIQVIIDSLVSLDVDKTLIKKYENALYDLINDKKFYRIKSQHSYANNVLNDIFSGNFKNIDLKLIKYPANKFTDMYQLSTNLINKEAKTIEELANLGNFFLDSVFFQVTITTPENEVSIFKTMNTTGLPLSKFDKLRIEFYEMTPSGDRANFNTKWSDLTSIIWEIGDSEESTINYIGRGVIDNTTIGSSQLVEALIEKARSIGVVNFIDKELIPAAKALQLGLKGLYPCGATSIALMNLVQLNRITRYRSIRPIIIASRNLAHSESDKIIDQLMKTVFVLSLSESRPQYNEDKFKEWSIGIQKNEVSATLLSMQSHVKSHSDAFRKNFPLMSLPYLGSDGVRFTLALAEQNILAAMGSKNSLPLIDIFPRDLFDIEHIAPRGFADEPSWNHLEAEFYTDALANLTMLEKARNRSVGKGAFTDKQVEYAQSKCYITSSITNSPAGGGKNNGAVMASKKLTQYTKWGSLELLTRNQQLADILCDELGVVKGQIGTPQQSIFDQGFLTIPQGRPESAMKVLLKANSGMTSMEELKESLIGVDNVDLTLTDRNFAYTLESIEYLGLGYRVDDIFTLSDMGREVVDLNGDIDKGLLRICLTASLLKSGLGIQMINKIKSNASVQDKTELRTALSILFPELSEVTLGHRIAGLFSWAKYIGENEELQDLV